MQAAANMLKCEAMSAGPGRTLCRRRKAVSHSEFRAYTLSKLEFKRRFLLLSARASCWCACEIGTFPGTFPGSVPGHFRSHACPS
eukprot:5437190-Prymnesium_polylepis.1